MSLPNLSINGNFTIIYSVYNEIYAVLILELITRFYHMTSRLELN